MNPDEFSESGRTYSDDFKKSYHEGSEFLESSLSTNTYSYDRESKYIVIDRQNPKENTARSYSPGFGEKARLERGVHDGSIHGASSLATSHTSNFQSNLASHSSKETLNEEDYEELAANLSYDDESLSLTLTDCQSQENSDYYPPSVGLPDLKAQERVSKYYTPSTKSYIGSGGLSLSDSNIQTQSNNLNENRLLASNFVTGSDRHLIRVSTPQLISSSLNNNSFTSASSNKEDIFESSITHKTSNNTSYAEQQSKSSKNQRTVPYHLRTPTKFRSARAGNLSTYISSRQSASKSGSTPCNRTLNRSASPKMLATPKKSRQSPARRMFTSSSRK